eukprot:CAMPEP_0170218122 /NCGR_PEP_ID=MMETSP0116_2-20130129/8731_1 /TAXON_ID=400756 /ORGANISM="Durinskia baltica, Strain CSIRO CS-38" /LENGTH=76 /DNA_ID=CAMNT_0010468765 /DNA_START=78 /DNA_END=304 /DNA_ORIENTATION=+
MHAASTKKARREPASAEEEMCSPALEFCEGQRPIGLVANHFLVRVDGTQAPPVWRAWQLEFGLEALGESSGRRGGG